MDSAPAPPGPSVSAGLPCPPRPPAKPQSHPRGNPGWAVLAWIVISLCIALLVVGRNLAPIPAEASDAIERMLLEIQGKYFIASAEFTGSASAMYAAAESLNTGSVGQRQRFIILAAELAGPAEAAERLAELDALIELEAHELSEDQVAVQQLLRKLYPPERADDKAAVAIAARLDALDARDRAVLIDNLGWFGRLALAPAGASNQAARADVLASARRAFFIILGLIGVLGLATLAGLVGVILVIVAIAARRMGAGLARGWAYHGLYAETFAIWLVLFFGLQFAAEAISSRLGAPSLMLPFAAFFLSLFALVWPVLRGVPWQRVREDIGWTLGRRPALEPAIGVAGYAMTLPLLAIGILLTFILMMIDQAFAEIFNGPPPTFSPTGGPAHPVVEQIARGGWWPRLQLLLLASVAAPMVEETMFRGVLYRHLRDATAWTGPALSIILSATVGGFIFAIIHPQGWVAVPALMSLAYGMTFVREWRGTLIPSIVIHATSNGIVMLTLIALVSA